MSEKIATVTYGKYSKEEWNKLTAKWSDPAFITQRHKLLGVQTDVPLRLSETHPHTFSKDDSNDD